MYNKTCKTCDKTLDTEHDYAEQCPQCYFKQKNQKPAKPESSEIMADHISGALNQIADGFHALAKAVKP